MIDDAHPIDPIVRREIEARLDAIEAEHDVRILYACESGSRGWGFASPDSDYDVRFLYVPRLSWYLRLGRRRDVIELPISGLLDINGWELRKALELLKKGNATLIEWLRSPVAYRADGEFLAAMHELVLHTHQPQRSFHHYIHMARKNHREHVRGERVRLKKYLYVLRPLLAALWVERSLAPAPMKFQDLVDGIVTNPALRGDIDELLSIKRTVMESGVGARFPAIDAFVAGELDRLETTSPPESRDVDFAALDTLLIDTVMRCDHRVAHD